MFRIVLKEAANLRMLAILLVCYKKARVLIGVESFRVTDSFPITFNLFPYESRISGKVSILFVELFYRVSPIFARLIP